MTEPAASSPEAALRHYRRVAAEFGPAIVVPGSLVNRTWMIGEPPQFALQRVAAQFDDDVNHRIERVTRRLTAAGVRTPELLRTDDDSLSLTAPSGERWRLLSWIAGTIHHQIPTPVHATSAAQLVAQFHDALFLSPEGRALPATGFHDTNARLAAMTEALGRAGDHRHGPAIQRLADELFEFWEQWRSLATPSAPDRPGHGDLKISNIVFDSNGPQALALIDLDTLGRYSLEAELGDALRSWCNPAGEDTAQPKLDVSLFEAAIAGYLGTSTTVRDGERGMLVHGLGRIALELAARFLTDAVDESYFAWNPAVAPSHAEHNLLRAAGQLELARQVAAERHVLEAIVERF